MTVITADDAFALGLIAQRPRRNADLVARLSSTAKPIGQALTGEIEAPPHLKKSVDLLLEWGKSDRRK